MKDVKKVLIFGAAGRVGLGLVAALLRRNINIVAADFVDSKLLMEKISRILVDTRLSNGDVTSQVYIYGSVDVLDETKISIY